MIFNPQDCLIRFDQSLLFEKLSLFEFSTMTEWVLSSFLLFIHASLINRMTIKNGQDKSLSLLPGLFYGIFMSLFPEGLCLSPLMMGNTFIILSLFALNNLYKKLQPAGIIFNAGMFAGMAFLSYFPLIIFVPVMVISMMSLRAQNIKELLQLTIGFLWSLFIFWSLAIILDSELSLVSYFKNQFQIPSFDSAYYNAISLFLIGMSIFLVVSRKPLLIKKSVQATKKIIFHFYFLFFSIFLVFIGNENVDFQRFLVVFLPMGIAMGLYLAAIKSRWLAELVHIGLLLCLFTLHFNLLQYINV